MTKSEKKQLRKHLINQELKSREKQKIALELKKLRGKRLKDRAWAVSIIILKLIAFGILMAASSPLLIISAVIFTGVIGCIFSAIGWSEYFSIGWSLVLVVCFLILVQLVNFFSDQ